MGEERHRIFKGGWIIVLFTVITILTVVITGRTGFGGTPDHTPVEPSDKDYYVIFAVEMPEKLSFAGEEVPLDLFDVREALDRELLSNTYFHSQTIRLLKLGNRYLPEIDSVLTEEGLPGDFKYMAVAESGLSNVVSPAGAVGFWQIRKGTGMDYGLEINNEVDERYDPVLSTRAACHYLRESYEKYGNWTMAAASYNAGRRGMDREIQRQKIDNYYDLLLNEETARYIFRILALKVIFEDPEAYGFHLSEKDLYQPVPYTTVEVSGPVADFADFAESYGINYKMLKFLNPWRRDKTLTKKSGKTYKIRILDKDFRRREAVNF